MRVPESLDIEKTLCERIRVASLNCALTHPDAAALPCALRAVDSRAALNHCVPICSVLSTALPMLLCRATADGVMCGAR